MDGMPILSSSIPSSSYWVYDTPIDPSWIHSPEIREKLQVAAIGTSTNLPEEVMENVKQSLQSISNINRIHL